MLTKQESNLRKQFIINKNHTLKKNTCILIDSVEINIYSIILKVNARVFKKKTIRKTNS